MTNILLATLLPALEKRFKTMKVGDTEKIKVEVPMQISGELEVIAPEYEIYVKVQTATWLEKPNVIYVTIGRKR